MADIGLTVTATVPTDASLTVVVEEDVDGDGTVDNSVSQSVADGTNSYTLSGFDGSGQIRVVPQLDTSDKTVTASVDSVEVFGPPTAPTNFSADTSDIPIQFSWTDNSTNEDGFRIYRPPDSPDETFDDGSVDLSFSGDWQITSAKSESGSSSYRSAPVGDGESSTTQITVEDARFIAFDWLVSSEDHFDFFNFYIDGDQKLHKSGTKGWNRYTAWLSDGSHTLEWEYTKDGSISDNADAAFIDNVTLGAERIAETDANQTSYSFVPESPQRHDYALTAFNETGESAFAGPVTVETQFDTVTATTNLPDVTGLMLDASDEDQFTATWDDVTDYGDYRVQARETNEGETWGAVFESTTDESDPSIVIPNLEDGEKYDVRVRAETEHATSAWTTATAVTLLPAPSNLQAAQPDLFATGQPIALSWIDNSDNPDEEWAIRYSLDGGQTWQTRATEPANTESYDFDAGTQRRTLTFRVRVQTEHVYADSGTVQAQEPYDAPDQLWIALPKTDSNPWVDITQGVTTRDTAKTHTGVGDGKLSFALDRDIDARVAVQDELWLFHNETLHFRGIMVDSSHDEGRGESTVTIKGLGKLLEEGRPLDPETVTYSNIRVEDAIRDYWGLTPFTATVRDQSPEQIASEAIVQDADVSNEQWLDIVSIPADKPFEVTVGNLAQLPTSQYVEGEDATTTSGSVVESNSNASGGQVLSMSSDGATAEYEVSFDHTIPEEYVGLRVRMGSEGDFEVSASVNGDTVEAGGALSLDIEWWQFTDNDAFAGGSSSEESYTGGDLQAGDTITVTISRPSGTADVLVDGIAVYDTRYSHTWDETLDANDALAGPEPYSRNELTLDEAEVSFNISAAHLDTTWKDGHVTGNELAVTLDGNEVLTAADTATLDQSFESSVGLSITPTVTMEGYGTQQSTPTQGVKGQEILSWELAVDGTDLAVIDDLELDGNHRDNLETLHSYGDYVYSIEHVRDALPVDSFPAGSETRSTDWRELNRTDGISGEHYYNSIYLKGAEGDDGTAPSTIVQDEQEIDEVGLKRLTARDLNVTTYAGAVYRARSILEETIRKNEPRGELTVAPVDLRPGFAYEVEFGGDIREVTLEEISYQASTDSEQAVLNFDPDLGLAGELAKLRRQAQETQQRL